jgi:hypothetical protein
MDCADIENKALPEIVSSHGSMMAQCLADMDVIEDIDIIKDVEIIKDNSSRYRRIDCRANAKRKRLCRTSLYLVILPFTLVSDAFEKYASFMTFLSFCS